MAQIPTSSITMAQIIAEVGLSGSQTLDACRAASVSYVLPASPAIPGHTRDGNEQTNTNASPHYNTMAEWAGYTHAQDLNVQEYLVRFSVPSGSTWPQTTYGLWQESVEYDNQNISESEREGGIYLFTKQVGGSTWVYADRLIPGQGEVGNSSSGKRYLANGTYDAMGSDTSNNGNNADVIIKIDEANVTVTVVVATPSATTLSGVKAINESAPLTVGLAPTVRSAS